jgi:hypothetical protein
MPGLPVPEFATGSILAGHSFALNWFDRRATAIVVMALAE